MTNVQNRAPSACTNALRVNTIQTKIQTTNTHRRTAAQAVAAALALMSASAVFAQTSAEGNLPVVVVTAARSAQVVTDALPSTTLISRADIEKSPVSDVVSLLKMQAGIVVRQTGPQGSRPTGVSIRGNEPNHTLILLDGIPMNTLSSGIGSIEQLPLAMIERIEVVRGNVSALYGSQATGGVVQIFTRKMEAGQSADIRVAGGTGNQAQASVQVRGGNDTVQATFGIAHEQVKIVSAMDSKSYPLTNTDRDGYRNESANGSVRYRPNDRNEFGLHFFESKGKGYYDSKGYYSYPTGTPVYDTDSNLHNEVRVENVNLYAKNRISNNWSSTVKLSQLTDVSKNFADYGNNMNKTRAREISWQNDIQTQMGDFILGGARTQQKLMSDTVYDNTRRLTTSLWAGYMLDKTRHHVQINVRSDKLSNLKRENTGALNYGFDVTPSTRVLASYSNGFAAPTFDQMYYPGYSNPLLKPEHAVYAQVGIQVVKKDFTGRLTAFQTLYRDKIDNDVFYIPHNIAHAKAQGVEWHGTYSRDGWTADVGLTYQEVKNRDTGKLLLRQPRVLASIGLGKAWGKWLAQVNWQAQGKMSDVSSSTVAGYGVVNAAAFYNIRPDVKVGLTLGNLFNRDYKPLYGYNAMPRNALLSLQYQPKW